MRVGFSPSIRENSDSARTLATRGSMPLISPQPVAPWFGLDLDEDDRVDPVRPQGGDLEGGRLSATWAAGFFSCPIASDKKALRQSRQPRWSSTHDDSWKPSGVNERRSGCLSGGLNGKQT